MCLLTVCEAVATLRRDCCGKAVHHEVKVGSPPTVYLNALILVSYFILCVKTLIQCTAPASLLFTTEEWFKNELMLNRG